MTSAPLPPETMHELMRALPSMSAVLDAVDSPSSLGLDPETATLCAALAVCTPRPLLREAIENFLDTQREAVRQGLVRDKARRGCGGSTSVPGNQRHGCGYSYEPGPESFGG